MANEIQLKDITGVNFTISLASLADASARQSTMVTNTNNYPGALIFLKIKSGATPPTAGQLYEVYLLRSNGTIRDDGAGNTDASIAIENAPLLGTIVVTANASKDFYAVLDTKDLGALGSEWGIAIKNSSGQALDSTEGNFHYSYVNYLPEVQ